MASINDVVLIYFRDKPLSFARIEDIAPDVKPNWYHVKLLLLQHPLQAVTWILRDVYIDGEPFTMGGNDMRIEKVVCPEAPEDVESREEESPEDPEENTGNVISFKSKKKE